jgi:quercetin dioxygenase-like cupin family protein
MDGAFMKTKNAVILRPSEIKSYERGGRASTTPLVTASLGSTSFINGITTFAPSAVIPFHSHNCEESVMLLEGDAMLDIDGESIPIQPLDTTWVPADVPHRFRNRSDIRPMKIFWTYARADATRTLTETGETNFISAEHVR